jgi:mono/diheme cytochrome c family protein
MPFKRSLLVVALTAGGLVATAFSLSTRSYAAPAPASDTANGMVIYAARCANCHGVRGAGGSIGPALKGEKARKDSPAVSAWIENPQPPMPKLYPVPLSAKDVADVTAYVETL